MSGQALYLTPCSVSQSRYGSIEKWVWLGFYRDVFICL